MYDKDLQRLEQTLKTCVSPYHCIGESTKQLQAAGFEELALADRWKLVRGRRYYVSIFDSSLMAFAVGENLGENPTIRMAAAHTDWPCLKAKPSPEVQTNRYGKLNIEIYGGPILSTWLDRPLSAAGKVCLNGADPFHPITRFVDLGRPIAIVPNLAIHMNREVNDGVKLNPQVDMLPLLTILDDQMNRENYFLNLLAEECGCASEDILDYEMYFYNLDGYTTVGLNEELYSGPRLDNITSVQACLTGIIEGRSDTGIQVAALYDHEEVGSRTKQGALSAVTERILEKVYLSLGYDRETWLNGMLDGFLLSLDVAHAMHPNHVEKCDIKNQILPGDGIAIKMAAAQSYATDATAVSVIESICKKAQIPYQKFSNRSDLRGGSTLGAISSSLLAMKAVDVGIPILAMHSARELMGTKDQAALVALTTQFFLI
ncbi:MAG: M18 family aminopeptidase [Hungatella sp.]